MSRSTSTCIVCGHRQELHYSTLDYDWCKGTVGVGPGTTPCYCREFRTYVPPPLMPSRYAHGGPRLQEWAAVAGKSAYRSAAVHTKSGMWQEVTRVDQLDDPGLDLRDFEKKAVADWLLYRPRVMIAREITRYATGPHAKCESEGRCVEPVPNEEKCR